MYQEERQKKILEYVNKHKKVAIKELSEEFNTSVVTIRADLGYLASQSLLIKTHGGAITNSYKINDIIPSDIKFETRVKEKKYIADIAKRYLEKGDVVIIDSGSTTLELAKAINSEELVVYTNDLQIGVELAKKPYVSLNISGGEMIKGVYTFAGYETVSYFENINVDKLFLSCDALDFEFGVSNRDRNEIAIKKAMIKASKEILLMLDHTKLNKKVAQKVAEVSVINKIIVDEIDAETKSKFESLGIEVITE